MCIPDIERIIVRAEMILVDTLRIALLGYLLIGAG